MSQLKKTVHLWSAYLYLMIAIFLLPFHGALCFIEQILDTSSTINILINLDRAVDLDIEVKRCEKAYRTACEKDTNADKSHVTEIYNVRYPKAGL